MKKLIELNNITKSFDGETVLDDISLYINDNEFITLLGPSGCGKTTMLRIIGGCEQPDQGDVIFMGKRINDMPPHKRTVNTVFQKYANDPPSVIKHILTYDVFCYYKKKQLYCLYGKTTFLYFILYWA